MEKYYTLVETCVNAEDKNTAVEKTENVLRGKPQGVEYEASVVLNYELALNGNVKIKKSLVYETIRKIGKELRIWFVDEDNPLHTYRIVEITDNEVIAEFID